MFEERNAPERQAVNLVEVLDMSLRPSFATLVKSFPPRDIPPLSRYSGVVRSIKAALSLTFCVGLKR